MIYMKYSALIVCVMLSGCATTALEKQPELTAGNIEKYKNPKSGVESIITNTALSSYNEKYLSASEHKALAQSLSGVWSWKSNRTSVEHAKTSALVACQKNNLKNEELYPCKIINIDGVWVK
jgi:hypothetical protein